MARVFLIVLDSFGIGSAPDAEDFGDAGANTLGHIASACAGGKADIPGVRSGPLTLPSMATLGLGLAAMEASGRRPDGISTAPLLGRYAIAEEKSKGKDTPSGHWEIAGVPAPFDWGYFPDTIPTFPESLTDALTREGNLPGLLGNKHASGTDILAEYGEEHIRTGKPIVYTSADSVLQIAAHEEHFGLQRLLDLCIIARRLVDPLGIGRVIARPFIGENAASFVRTANRRDYAVPPPEPTLLDRVENSGHKVFGIGKIGDIFAHVGVTEVRKGAGNDALFDATLGVMDDAKAGDLVFANFVDFDTLYGHRRDVAGYAAALEAFDRRLPELLARMKPQDLLILTADHGCDPTWRGTDHTREIVPVLMAGQGIKPGYAGRRQTFADIGETAADWLHLPAGRHGTSMLAPLEVQPV
ncbi:Phosphopentomutase [Hartmannibacter diazotrophicus]|uniref:Phosphopentomutase n=1 Tax=Hartmannibacter diazotrophicus TaxID=1482074 RepID=A0A2C9D1U6_9HYPH|nr:phosphopentomutase [Hartmannibacter diazotrophicus]SON54204.1 Phosphopentomutase [Hartmannibacter diazotrophicus]